jgi:hypothetical protein
VAALSSLGARVIGLAASGATAGNPKARALALATDTRAVVDVGDFGPAGTRSASCSVSQCCTGLEGAGEAPAASGSCPLGITYTASTGAGVADGILAGVSAMVAGARFDVDSSAADVDVGAVSSFVASLGLVTDGSDGLGCLVAPANGLADQFTGPQAAPGADGIPDTVKAAKAGSRLCVRIVSKANTTIANEASAQFFRVSLQARSAGPPNLAFGTPVEVTFMVPPK